eukprot:scaffold10954_cov63-Phaeocystis_antarctica.AAC.2
MGERELPPSLQASLPFYQPASPPMTTSPDDMMSLMEWGTTAAVMGNSTGAVFTTRTTLPEPG